MLASPTHSIIDKRAPLVSWAAPKKTDGSFDHDKALTGDDLIDYVNHKLFPICKAFKQRADGPRHDRIQDRRDLRRDQKQVPAAAIRCATRWSWSIDCASARRRKSTSCPHLYEAKIKNMGNAGRNGGEYYTPRPLIRAMIQVVKPKIGERIYDGALRLGGLPVRGLSTISRKGDLTTSQLKTLQTRPSTARRRRASPMSSPS